MMNEYLPPPGGFLAGTKRLSEPDYQLVVKLAPRVAVDLLIQDPEGRVLLVRRAVEPWIGYWHFPGGGVRKNELLGSAITRIAFQEAGLLPVKHELLDAADYLHERPLDRHTVALLYRCTHFNGATPRKDENATDIGWFTEPPENMIPDHKHLWSVHVSPHL